MTDYLELSDNAAQSLASWLKTQPYRQLAILCDENTVQFCLPKIRAVLPQHTCIITIPAGEQHKTLESCTLIWQALTQAGFSRNDLLINLGGGVIGDMGGFCASTYKRGLDFINLPTTLLASVDASIGGKLGIDFQGLKNHIGLFRIPKRVIIDPAFLESLPERELRSGYAEVVKHALIADASHWELLQHTPWQQHHWPEIIRHSLQIKQHIVGQDPEEKGVRKALNFGHTLGHAIESLLLEDPERRLLHGEAIAMGMQCAAWLSYKACELPVRDMRAICTYLAAIWPQPEFTAAEQEAIIQLSLQDKKNDGNVRLFSLLSAVGKAEINVAVKEGQAREALDWQQKKGWR